MKTNLKSRLFLILISVCLLTLIFGALVEAETFNFYVVSHGGPGDPFWGVVMKGMKEGAEAITKGTGIL